MAISLQNKTLQAVEYDLYGKTSIMYMSATVVAYGVAFYQSQGHYTDGFLPIIKKDHVLSDVGVINTLGGIYPSPSVITALENYTVGNIAFYSGATVVA